MDIKEHRKRFKYIIKLQYVFLKPKTHTLSSCYRLLSFQFQFFSTLSTYLYFLANLYLPYLSMLAESYSCLFAAGLIVSPTKASEIA